MNVVLEGPDGGGKSTLGRYLSDQLGLPLQHSGGPSKFPGEIALRAFNYIQDPMFRIYDRHPCVSQNIYNAVMGRTSEGDIPESILDQFYAKSNIIIYCRPMKPLRDHVATVYNASIEHHDMVEKNYAMLIKYYDAWAHNNATMTYRVGDNMERVADMIRGTMDARPFDPFQDVVDFHVKMGKDYRGLPRVLPDKLQNFRETGIEEEFGEYTDAAAWAARCLEHPTFDSDYSDGEFRVYLEKMLDALVDLTYFALGTAHCHGFNFREAWRRVHRANMMKVPMRTKRGDGDNDVGKPPGWVAPTHADLVRNHAHLQKLPVANNAGLVQVQSA